jgi:polar amino acid transport system substrate-binding protein
MKQCLAALAFILSACSSVPAVSPEARNELAPAGRIRVAINYGNPVLARMDPATKELGGVAVTLARELGRDAGVPVELVGYDTVAKLLAGLKAGAWDVGFLAVDPARAGDVSFTAPYMEVEVSYLVREGSAVRGIADVDRPGMRIALQEKNAADLYLSRELRHAKLVRTPNAAAAFAALKDGSADALAENGQFLSVRLQAEPGFRIIPGRFTTIPHAAAVPAGRAAAAAFVRGFIDRAKASGQVQRAIDEARIRGVVVAR